MLKLSAVFLFHIEKIKFATFPEAEYFFCSRIFRGSKKFSPMSFYTKFCAFNSLNASSRNLLRFDVPPDRFNMREIASNTFFIDITASIQAMLLR